jgi:2-octaprenyl-6-methoxyphenol hydroxylase
MARRVVIGGFGAAGCATALALHSGGMAPDDLLVFDANPASGGPPAGPDARILALNPGTCRFLDAIGVWAMLKEQAWPMHSMALSDTALEEDFRPKLLDIGASDTPGPLAQMVPLGRLNAALRESVRAAGIAVIAAPLKGVVAGEGEIRVDLGERIVEAALLVGADGAHSPVRKAAGIATHGWAYGQTAIVATIRHSLAHHGEAVQHFLPSGPFALLPLDEYRSSIVWSEKTTHARHLLADEPNALRRAIVERAAGWRGEIEAVEAVSAHPLHLMLARRFIGERVALVADSAHVVHPLAGQGLNLGLEDAAMLAELIIDRMRLGLDPGVPDLLEAYQAHRRPAAAAMAFATDGINRLFSNDFGPLRILRDIGLGLVDRLPAAKRRFVEAASGQGGLAPRLFRGEAI